MLGESPLQVDERGQSQLDEQPPAARPRRIFAQDNLAATAGDLADPSCTVAFVPTLLEPERVDVEMQSSFHVSHEEYRPRIPAMNRLTAWVSFRHRISWLPNGWRVSGERRAEGDERVRCMRVLAGVARRACDQPLGISVLFRVHSDRRDDYRQPERYGKNSQGDAA